MAARGNRTDINPSLSRGRGRGIGEEGRTIGEKKRPLSPESNLKNYEGEE